MRPSTRQCVLAVCATVLVGGCATQRNAAPEYRLSSATPVAVVGASMLQRGRAQLDAGLDALAIESFRAEIRVSPDSAEAYNGLAVAYSRIGRDDLAQRYFEMALAIDPVNSKAQANLARLGGDEAVAVRLADANLHARVVEPVVPVTTAQPDPIGQLIDRIESPALVSSVMAPAIEAPSTEPVYALARKGVLSTHFVVAPVRFVEVKPMAITAMPHKPIEPPKPTAPSIPVANLPADYRAGAVRLVRVSLGEVHLVTRPDPQPRTAARLSKFESFGDRLATWLPQSIAMEQAASAYRTKEGTALLAAIDRAAHRQKIAPASDVVLPELPEFAYLAFDTNADKADA